MKQPQLAVFCNQHVEAIIVVHIANGHARAKPGHIEPRTGAHVAKRAIGLLLIQHVRSAGVRRRALQQENIEPAIAIEIQQRRAVSHALRHEIRSGGTGIVHGGNA